MQIETWPIDRPKDYKQNARKWTAKAVEKVASSIKEYGWRQPVVVDADETIVIGHLRRAAGKSIGLTECPVHVARDLSPVQIRGLRLADNRVAQEAVFDEGLLSLELLDLKALDFDLNLTGFDMREIDVLLADPEGDDAANECPELPVNPVSQLGDLWLLGPHRVLCGDSTSAEEVSRLLGGQKAPFIMVTDPPYGVEYEPEWRDRAFGEANLATGKVKNDDCVDWSRAWGHFPGDVAYVWHAGIYAGEVAVGLMAQKFQIRGQIVWAKQHFAIGRGAYHWQHEPCWYSVRKGKSAHWHGDRTQSTLWQVNNGLSQGGGRDASESATGHGTQKPIELMRRPILNHTERGEAVYDPFLGSGTTLIAAELTERICYGVDIDPKYVDVIVQRWQKQTNKQATLDGHGATFEHVKEGRLLGAEDAIKEEVMEMLEAKR